MEEKAGKTIYNIPGGRIKVQERVNMGLLPIKYDVILNSKLAQQNGCDACDGATEMWAISLDMLQDIVNEFMGKHIDLIESDTPPGF